MSKKNKKEKINIEENFKEVNSVEMHEVMKESYINYALDVIEDRALPDVRDGLKPVMRRILYAMSKLQLSPEQSYRKSARVVGDVLGKYHPHGDSSVYLAMVRMAQDFKNSLPIVDGHGNFGSIDGDSPAHMRYTEAKLTPFAMTMLEELKNGVVDYKENFDGRETEPTVMPTKMPVLLVNGSNGVAVGMATSIPTHNPSEVIDAFIAYIDNPDISIERLCDYIPAPDFPTGATIVNADEFREGFYYKGEGSLRIRSVYHIEDAPGKKKNIVITEIPFTLSGSKNTLISKMLDMIANKTLDECSDIRDESNKDGIRIVIVVKKGVNIDKLLKKLMAKTQMEDSTKYRFLALNNRKEPTIYNLKTYFEDVLDFQKDFYIRKYKKILASSESRKEILNAYISAYDFIDTIVEVIRNTKAKNKAEATELVKKVLTNGEVSYLEDTDIMKKHIKIAKGFSFTENQANAILKMQLISLMNLDVDIYKEELESTEKTIIECISLITNDRELNKLIKKELRSLKKKVAIERRTKLDNISKEKYKYIAEAEDLLVLIDDLGYLKVLDVPKNYSKDNYSEFKFAKIIKSTDSLRFFTNKGNYIQLKMLGLDKTKGKDRGKLIETLIELSEDEKILLYDSQSDIIKSDLIILTKNSLLKRMEGTELNTTYNSISFTKLEDDAVLDIKIVDKDLYYDIKVESVNGSLKTIDKSDIKFLKKTAKGDKVFKNIESKELIIIPKENPEIEEETQNKFLISFDSDGNLIEMKKN